MMSAKTKSRDDCISDIDAGAQSTRAILADQGDVLRAVPKKPEERQISTLLGPAEKIPDSSINTFSLLENRNISGVLTGCKVVPMNGSDSSMRISEILTGIP